MYKVLIVEDEPVAAEHVCSMFSRYVNNFTVVGVVSNGREALPLIDALCPHLVITDIRMPIMDGLELSRLIFENYPDVYTIIVSGYQDFEYARHAIKYKVLEYLLKPITPNSFKKTLERTKKHIDQIYSNKKYQLIKIILQNKPLESWRVRFYFPEPLYVAALVRNGGLPRQLTANFLTDVFSNNSNSIIVYGRDEQESLYICPSKVFSFADFELMLQKHSNNLPAGYKTTVLYKSPFPRDKLYSVLEVLYKSIREKIILGKNQAFFVSESSNKPQRQKIRTDKVFQLLDLYLYNGSCDKIKSILTKQINQWEKEELPLITLEKAVHQIFGYITLKSSRSKDADLDFLLEDAFFLSENYSQLTAYICDICDNLFGDDPSSYSKVDTPEFFGTITNFMEKNLSEQHSLSSICSTFHLSQTYLSRLFRKYTNSTFNEYLNKARIDRAKELLVNHPDMLIQEIAQIVGYKDQFYFSRLFRSFTGVPPTEYSDL